MQRRSLHALRSSSALASASRTYSLSSSIKASSILSSTNSLLVSSRSYSTEEGDNASFPPIPNLPFSADQMALELKTLGKMAATIKRTKNGTDSAPGVSVTVAGSGRLEKVQIDDDLAGDLPTIERLIVEAYLDARVAVFDSMRSVVSEKLRRDKEKGL